MSSPTRETIITERLTAAFSPAQLEVINESQQHIGHAGAQGGAGHYAVHIIAQAFTGLSLVQRHQRVYDVLKDLIPNEIHALKIKAKTPEEV